MVSARVRSAAPGLHLDRLPGRTRWRRRHQPAAAPARSNRRNAPVGSASAAASGNAAPTDPPSRNGGLRRARAATAPTSRASRRGTAPCCCTIWRRWWNGVTPSGAAAIRRKHSSRRVSMFDAARLILGQAPRKVRMLEAAVGANGIHLPAGLCPAQSASARALRGRRRSPGADPGSNQCAPAAQRGAGPRAVLFRQRPACAGLAERMSTPVPMRLTGAICPAPTGSCS